MNCLEFRRLYAADPSNKPDKIIKHRQTCQSCHIFSIQVDELETKLTNIINIDIPEGMEERIISAKKVTNKEE